MKRRQGLWKTNDFSIRDYAVVKQIILNRFQLNAGTYLHRFRSVARTGNESYSLFLNRLDGLLSYYLDAKQVNDFEALREDIVLQQFLTSLPTVVRAFVEARVPESPSKAAELADLHFQIAQAAMGLEITQEGIIKSRTINPAQVQRRPAQTVPKGTNQKVNKVGEPSSMLHV